MTEQARSSRYSLRAIIERWGPALLIAATVLGGYWFLIDKMLEGINQSVADLRSETGQRIEGREAEDRDIRAVIQSTNESLRAEIGRQGDRIVQASAEIGARIEQMRSDLVMTIKDGVNGLESGFDRLDEKFDALLSKINYETIEIPWEGGSLHVEEDGSIIGPDGKPLGTLPAVLKLNRRY